MRLPCITLCLFAYISTIAQSPRFFNNDKLIITGVYYYPEHWDESQWERDLKQIKDLGFEFVHYAEFAWAQIEPSEGVYDFAWLDKAVGIAAKNGLKVIMCTSTATPPVWLKRKYPEILIERENGTKTDHGARQHPSVSSNFFRTYSLKTIEKLAEHYGKDSRIMGWQLDNEPRPNRDYGKDAQKRFQNWLLKKYQTIDALNKAWGTVFWSQTYSSIEEINIPRFAQMFMNSHQILDYNRFSTEEMSSFLDDQAKAIRKYTGKNQWITTNYIPDYDDGHLRQSPELDFHAYMRSKLELNHILCEATGLLHCVRRLLRQPLNSCKNLPLNRFLPCLYQVIICFAEMFVSKESPVSREG